MRRNVLAFFTGALIALAGVLVVREAGSSARGSTTGVTGPAPSTATTTAARPIDVRLHRRRPAHRRPRRVTPAPSTTAVAARPAARPTPSLARAPASTPRPHHAQTHTTPPTPEEPVPGDGDTPTPPQQPPATTPAVTIPDAATPDASVGQPGG